MSITILADAPPWRIDDDGAVRIGDSRVLLELVVRAFQDGATAETIVQRYPSASLANVYATIAYLLRRPAAVEQYLAERDARAAEVRERIEDRQGDLADIRARLLKHASA